MPGVVMYMPNSSDPVRQSPRTEREERVCCFAF